MILVAQVAVDCWVPHNDFEPSRMVESFNLVRVVVFLSHSV